MISTEKIIGEYLNKKDWRVNENSNSDYSLSGLMFHTSGESMKPYTLKYVYNKEIRMAHELGDIHIHDLTMGISGYCAGWSIAQLLSEGFNGIKGKTDSRPPNHLDAALGQIINFIGVLQNEWAGAQAFSSFDTYLSVFVKKDNLSYEEVKQAMEGFVYNLNCDSRWGGQTPFSNLTFDWVVPEDMKDNIIAIAGELQNFTYEDCQKEMDMINKAFLEIMYDGDASERIFTFPIPTYNITKNFNWDSENADLLFKLTAKYGLPYFQNFINSDLDPSDVRSMCCRLQMDIRELRNKGDGGLFGAGEMTGSVGVVTINMPRLGHLSKNEGIYFRRLSRLLRIAKESLEIKRKVVQNNIDNNLMPYTKRYLKSLKRHFSTIGIIGMHESLLNFKGIGIETEEGIEFSKKVINFINEKLKDFQEETGNMYNSEAVPGEGLSYRFAIKDKEMYPDIIFATDNDVPYYTNSTNLPVGFTDNLGEALNKQEELLNLYTGGAVFHAFIGESYPNPEGIKKLVKSIASKYTIRYFSITPTFSLCPTHKYLSGEHFTCPTCGKDCEVYSRIVGYFRDISQWNKGKKSEFSDRQVYNYE